jgi:hypothetical protein
MITSKLIRNVATSLEFLCMSVLSPKVTELTGGLFISVLVFHRLTIIPSSLTQTTLDGAIPTRPRVPQFTTAGVLDYVVELVVCEDEVRLIVE